MITSRDIVKPPLVKLMLIPRILLIIIFIITSIISVSAETSIEEKLAKASTDCETGGGTTLNIKGELYCNNNEEYIPLQKYFQDGSTTIMGASIPNIGGMLFPKDPMIGWFVLLIISVFAYSVYKTERKKRIERSIMYHYNNIRQEGLTEEDSRDYRKTRSDGGYY